MKSRFMVLFFKAIAVMQNENCAAIERNIFDHSIKIPHVFSLVFIIAFGFGMTVEDYFFRNQPKI